ncbi:MAG: hypothetical protein K0S23_334 [Fluviicola sp.]|jgi:hypothetical protein|nr:hypothetical protein [Fluviicola sp.]
MSYKEDLVKERHYISDCVLLFRKVSRDAVT